MIDGVGQAFPGEQLDRKTKFGKTVGSECVADSQAERFRLFEARGDPL
jgi:hypothetical protein